MLQKQKFGSFYDLQDVIVSKTFVNLANRQEGVSLSFCFSISWRRLVSVNLMNDLEMTTFHKLYIVLDFCFCNIFCHADNVTHTHPSENTSSPFFCVLLGNRHHRYFCSGVWTISNSTAASATVTDQPQTCIAERSYFPKKVAKMKSVFLELERMISAFLTIWYLFQILNVHVELELFIWFCGKWSKKVNYVKSVAQHHQKRETAGMAQVARPRWPQVSLKSALKRTDWIS